MPYKSPIIHKSIYKSIQEINLNGIGQEDGNVRVLNTKEFTEEERANRVLDVITGFEFIDSEYRILILEGIGGKGWGMNKLYRENER